MHLDLFRKYNCSRKVFIFLIKHNSGGFSSPQLLLSERVHPINLLLRYLLIFHNGSKLETEGGIKTSPGYMQGRTRKSNFTLRMPSTISIAWTLSRRPRKRNETQPVSLKARILSTSWQQSYFCVALSMQIYMSQEPTVWTTLGNKWGKILLLFP
jgi:hypothetical protein